MSVEKFFAHPLEEFRGLWTKQNKPANEVGVETPMGYASATANTDYLPGRVFKRPGLTSVYGPQSEEIVSISEYVTNAGLRRVLRLDEINGGLSKETGSFSFSSIDTLLVDTDVTPILNAQTMFGRHYMAFGANNLTVVRGYGDPRHYNDTNLDRVSQVGPGKAPTIADGAAGTVSAGVHKCRVFFKTRSGYWTALSPEASVTAAGAKKIDVTNIPLGPPNVVARVLAFTPADSEDYYFIAGTTMEVNDNTTTSVTGIDFADTALIAGVPVSSTTNPDEDLLRQIELPAQAGVVGYKRRLAWFGERASLVRNGDVGFLNLSFDGGFTANVPNGWTEVAAGQGKSTVAGATGEVLTITGDGANQKGRLQNNANAFGAIPVGVALNARVRIKLNASNPAAAGTFHVFWTGTGAPAADLTINVATAGLSTSRWKVVEGEVLSAANNKPATDWKLNITSGGTGYGGTALTAAGIIEIDRIELYEAEQKYAASLVRWSKVDDPEAYDGLSGIMNVAEDNGQALTAAFVLRDTCYFVKERSLYATRDNGVTEPNEWSVEEVSAACGAASPDAVAVGDGWAIIAGRQGVMFFDGGTPVCISEEIATTWAAEFDWVAPAAIWVRVDTQERRIFVGTPLTTGTTANRVFYCRYEGPTPVSGKRDWSYWSSAATTFRCATFSERSDGKRLFLLAGSGGGNSRIYKLDVNAKNDGSSAIASTYQTAFFGESSTRSLIGYITLNAVGTGNLLFQWVAQSGLSVTDFAKPVLSENPTRDYEQICRIASERAAFKFGTTEIDETWTMRKFVPYLNSKPAAKVRGIRG